MGYAITKIEGLDEDYYGYKAEYRIDFTFVKQKATVTIEVRADNEARLVSNTDGYHWLQFFLCQEPNCSKLIELGYDNEVGICEKIFGEKGIAYIQEGKNTAWLSCNKIDEEFVKIVANIIEPRFANRERFFVD